jgi:hypothetical protein
MFRTLHLAALILLALVLVFAGAWGALAITYGAPPEAPWRMLLAGAFGLVSCAVLIALTRRRWRWPACAAYGLLYAVLLLWWHGIEPSNAREWRTDVALLPYATVEGERVTVHNIRNFTYRSETDYTPAYYDKQFDLRQLQAVDLIAVYWMGPEIAHVFLSFAFAGGEHLAISIETRNEKGETYSTLKGFFRQYELYYVVADERDLIGLRTNYRRDPPEDVYVYRTSGPIENGRRLFMEYMAQINALKEKPVFYNTLTTNCTTNIWLNSHVNPEHLPFNWKILVSGYVPAYLFENGLLESGGLSFPELRQRVHVNARAQAADKAADFSRRIRERSPDGNVDSLSLEGRK